MLAKVHRYRESVLEEILKRCADFIGHPPLVVEFETWRHNAAVRFVVALRSPVAFRRPGSFTTNWATAELEAVAIAFDGFDFVWHPPMTRENEGGTTNFGPMVSVAHREPDSQAVVSSLQRFLSAVAYRYGQPVEDVIYGGTGDSEPYNPAGARALRYFPAIYLVDAPKEIRVAQDEMLWRALALYREGVNASSPIYACLSFWNVLVASFDVLNETQGPKQTLQASARDAFIEARAGLFAEWHKIPDPRTNWATYFRDEVRNAAAHVIRPAGKRVLNPDAGRDRALLRNDAAVLGNLASEAIGERWQEGVIAVREDA